jgi:hypothetical protein
VVLDSYHRDECPGVRSSTYADCSGSVVPASYSFATGRLPSPIVYWPAEYENTPSCAMNGDEAIPQFSSSSVYAVGVADLVLVGTLRLRREKSLLPGRRGEGPCIPSVFSRPDQRWWVPGC